MRAWIVAAAAIAAFSSLPARADQHYPVVHAHPYFSFGYGFGYPYWGPYRPYYPYYYPWGPTFGFGVTVVPHAHEHEHEHDDQSNTQQQGFKLYVYPAAGQSDAQTSEDRYQCHLWATNQSGYDPTLGAGKREDAEGYTRAFTACMQGRNYVVK